MALIGLVFVTFISPPRLSEQQTIQNLLVTQLFFAYILLEFLYFAYVVTTRIANTLGIMVFKSGKTKRDPVEDFLNREKTPSELKIPLKDSNQDGKSGVQLKNLA